MEVVTTVDDIIETTTAEEPLTIDTTIGTVTDVVPELPDYSDYEDDSMTTTEKISETDMDEEVVTTTILPEEFTTTTTITPDDFDNEIFDDDTDTTQEITTEKDLSEVESVTPTTLTIDDGAVESTTI